MHEHVLSSNRFEALLVDGHLLVYDKGLNICELLNQSAAVLFLLLAENGTDITNLLHEANQLLPKLSLDSSHIDGILGAWRDRDWIRLCANNKYEINDCKGESLTSSWPLRNVKREPGRTIPSKTKAQHRGSTIICLNGLDYIQVNFYQASGKTLCPQAIPRLQAILKGVAAPVLKTPSLSIDFCVEAHQAIISTAQYTYNIVDESYALSTLATELLRYSYGKNGMILSAHAAGIGKHGSQILLPAQSGAGKSTLTASLVADGWQYYGDDVVALRQTEANYWQILPFTTAIGVKPGSWPILKQSYPELKQIKITDYAGKKAKFLPVNSCSSNHWQTGRISAIVVPKYKQKSNAQLRKLSVRETVSKFLLSGVSFMHDVEDKTHNLRTWLNWLESTPSYELIFDDYNEAQPLLEGIL